MPENSAEKWKVVLMVLVATLAVSVGETLLSKGMKQTTGDGFGVLRSALTNGYVVGGTLLMMLYFGTYTAALKVADFSFVLPLTALSYLIGGILAKYYLKEDVNAMRWIGTFVITIGVIIVGLGGDGSRK